MLLEKRYSKFLPLTVFFLSLTILWSAAFSGVGLAQGESSLSETRLVASSVGSTDRQVVNLNPNATIGRGGGTLLDEPEAQNKSAMMLELDVDDALASGTSVFLFFYADWCDFCQRQMPIIDEIEQEYGNDIVFIRINSQKSPQAMEKFGVTGIPAMFFIFEKDADGIYVYQRFKGLTDKESLKESFDGEDIYLADGLDNNFDRSISGISQIKSSDHINLKDTNYCLNTPYRGNYGDVFLWTCDCNDDDQKWVIQGELIKLKDTNYCLNTPYRKNYGDVFLWTCDSSDPDQQWIREGERFRLKNTNYCLNTPYRGNYGDIFLWTCDDSDPDQKWVLGINCDNDDAQFVADVTIPDGTDMDPNDAFTKTWRIRNTGNTIWDSGYKLKFQSGAQMGGPGYVSLPHDVSPNQTVDISVNLTAPLSAGTYQGYWRMRNSSGQVFGNTIWVLIDVVPKDTCIISLNGDLHFGNVLVNTTATRILTISNIGNSTLHVTSIEYPDGFNVNWSGNIGPGHSQNVTVTFTPTAEQYYSGTITVNSDATGGTNTIGISGTGIPSGGSYHAYFEEAGQRYEIPYNLLKAIGHAESGWNQGAHNGDDLGVMQLNEINLPTIADRLIYDYPNDYENMSNAQMVALLTEDSSAGAQANIRGAASKLRYDADNVTGLIYPGEPQDALEPWWFVLTYYNGGGAEQNLNTSNYPFRVYNCFLTGITVDGDVRVPQIPITLVPHVTFRRVAQSENEFVEISASDRDLIPRSPLFEYDDYENLIAGFIRKTENFHSCTDLRTLHDNDGNVMNTENVQSCDPYMEEPFKLEFPLRGLDHQTATITSVFDYSSPTYAIDDYVVGYTGHYGTKDAGANDYGNGVWGYMSPAGINFQDYITNYDGTDYLYYDGHPAYDYQALTGTELYATADGTFHVVGGTCNTAYIDHGNGYRTYYLHSDSYEPGLNGTNVTAGQLIGTTGSAGTRHAHLHLEIRKGGNPVDPYGWHGDRGDDLSWTRAINSILWEAQILALTPTYQNVPATDGSTSFDVANTGTDAMYWTATSNSSWLTIVSGASGTNEGIITATYQVNSGTARTGTITVTASGAMDSPQTIEVTQEEVLPSIGLGHASNEGCHRIDVWYPQMNFGQSHWNDIRVYDENGNSLGWLSEYHRNQSGCNTYFRGNSQWPNSYYRFHGTKEQLRERGLPRKIKVQFINESGHPYTKMSGILDLGPDPWPDPGTLRGCVYGDAPDYLISLFETIPWPRPNKPLSGASVTIAGRSDITDKNGYYSIDDVPAGTYTATCTHPYYYYWKLSAQVTISDGGTTTKNWYYEDSVK